MERNIIEIDQEKCTGCSLCIPNCPEGAIQIIDGKARLVSDLMCDGLGACLGHCPEGAITVVKREAEEYDERKVMVNIVKQGANTIKAHLTHLKDHKQDEYYKQAIAFLNENRIGVPMDKPVDFHHAHSHEGGGCPGSRSMAFAQKTTADADSAPTGPVKSELTHWPIQLHLMSPNAPHYQGADVVLAADCVAYSLGDFHSRFLKGRTLAIACPKLDEGQDVYSEKITALVDSAQINTLTVIIMQVPCCGGLLRLAQAAVAKATRKIPLKSIVVGLQGEILREEWV